MKTKLWAIGLVPVALIVSVMIGPLAGTEATAAVHNRTYTTDADFDEGTLVGVEHETVDDQLQLSKEAVVLPFIWVPNENGTVSKIDTETGDELGRYWVSPYSNTRPSRTTVDLDGSCWVGVRRVGTVVKIGLYEAGIWIDRNGNGICDTSLDLNGDGDITGAELRPWGQDECVLYEVVLIPGKEGTYAPGTYTGGYESNDWHTSPRGLAVDAANNLWAGTWGSRTYYYIDGSTGAILRSVYTGWPAYGAVIDANGILWSSTQENNRVLRLDPSTDAVSTVHMGHFVYGLGVDYLDHLFVAGWHDSKLSRVDVLTTTIDWTKWGPYCARGVVCTSDNDVWVASTPGDKVYRFDNDGTSKTSIDVALGGWGDPTGVAVDAAGKVWVCNLDGWIHRINPATNTVDLSKYIVASGGHYTYSDMTGIISRTITTKIGTWTVVFDSQEADTPWGTISWTSDEPEGTSVTVKVRSSNSETGPWSAWEDATNAVPLSGTPDARYLQIETTLQSVSGEDSPVLYDLTVQTAYIEVDVDIKPGSDPNSINLGSKGVLPVAILSTDDFDARDVDEGTVDFGDPELPGIGIPIRSAEEDVDGDGNADLVLFFSVPELVESGALDEESQEALLSGETFDGVSIIGGDSVRIVPPEGKGKSGK